MSSELKPAISLPAQDSAGPGVSRIALTIDEAASALGVTRRTIEHEINKGTIRPRLFGRHHLISVDALKKLFK